jgi:signal recognition particle subunit SRP54
MVLDKLGASLQGALQKLAKSVFISDTVLAEIIKDIQKALIYSDVNIQLVFKLTTEIKKRAKTDELPPGLSKREQIINIVYDELTKFLGGEFEQIKVTTDKKPFKIMLVGLFGNGKTTQAGKLGKYFTKRGYKVAAVATDTWRPAAYEQLKINAARAGISFFGESPDPARKKDPTYPAEIYKKFESEYSKYDVLIVDTAGRDALNGDLVTELKTLNDAVAANEIFLIMGADLGQTAEKQAQSFHDAVGVSGVIISKMDGTAKGGGALSACAITEAKVKFLGVGEGIDDLEEFKPKNFVGSLLGMGDLETLLQKAQDAFNQPGAEDQAEKMMKGDFGLRDLYDQMQAMKKMGSLTKVMSMIPGMSGMNIPKEALQAQEGKMDGWKFIMDSCTKTELAKPELITVSRIDRIVKGSGRDETDIRELLKQYKQSKKVIKAMKGNLGSAGGKGGDKKMQKMLKRMGGMKGLGGMNLGK